MNLSGQTFLSSGWCSWYGWKKLQWGLLKIILEGLTLKSACPGGT